MTSAKALSQSPSVLNLIQGPTRTGLILGHGYIDFSGYVVALTPPGKLRMPNGLETEWQVERGETARAGDGSLEVGGVSIHPGPIWDSRPRPRFRPEMIGRVTRDLTALAGLGEGLTPAGDDILIGYVAAIVMFHHAYAQGRELAQTAGSPTTALSRTLLSHPSTGELPEAARHLLEKGDPDPLLAFGHSSGRCLLVGLALGARISHKLPRRAAHPVRPPPALVLDLDIPLSLCHPDGFLTPMCPRSSEAEGDTTKVEIRITHCGDRPTLQPAAIRSLSTEGLIASAPHALRLFSGELFNHDVMTEAAKAIDELQPHHEPNDKDVM
ncbi:MAG: DUF2877 domain-containing protein [Acidobacteria bacterium]|nr:DUF2877 domain-containing protein [Acidobacteriota bacterium]